MLPYAGHCSRCSGRYCEARILRSLISDQILSFLLHSSPISTLLCFSLYVKTTTASLLSAASGSRPHLPSAHFLLCSVTWVWVPVLALTTESIRASDIEQSFLHYYSSSTSAAILFPFPGIAGVCPTPPQPAPVSLFWHFLSFAMLSSPYCAPWSLLFYVHSYP